MDSLLFMQRLQQFRRARKGELGMVHQQHWLAAMIAGEFAGGDNRTGAARTGGGTSGPAPPKDQFPFNGMGRRRAASDLDRRRIAGPRRQYEFRAELRRE